MKCPHCNKITKEPYLSNAQRNVESYGGGTFYFECHKCHKRYGVFIERIVKVRMETTRKVPDDKDLSYG